MSLICTVVQPFPCDPTNESFQNGKTHLQSKQNKGNQLAL